MASGKGGKEKGKPERDQHAVVMQRPAAAIVASGEVAIQAAEERSVLFRDRVKARRAAQSVLTADVGL